MSGKIEIRGNVLGFVTALLILAGIAWQSYEEYAKAHPKPTTLQPPSASVTPIYWNDGQRWWCQVGDKRYIWTPNQTDIRLADNATTPRR